MLYKKLCWEQGLLSHDDVLYFSYLLIKRNKKIREIIRAKFPYFLIDEFQDTSPLQVAIIKLLAKKRNGSWGYWRPLSIHFLFPGG
ncbi:UvrD-helicase domain-containing protein [Bacillus cereus]